MAINLVETLMEPLTGPLIKQLADLIGESAEKIQTAATGIVPALLSGLAGMASKPDGASVMGSLLDRLDDSLLDHPGGWLGGPQAATVAQSGGNLLINLFGETRVSGLIASTAKYAGIGAGSAKSLLGFLAPLVLGGIKRLMRRQGLDIAGLTQLLLSQKDSFRLALPTGLANLLGATGSFPDLAPTKTRTSPARPQVSSSAATHENPYQKWLAPVLGLLFLGILVTWWVARETPEPVRQAGTPAYRAPGEPGSMPGSISIPDQLTQAFSTADSTLRGITNTATAQDALPTLRNLNAQLEELRTAVSQAPASTKDMVKSRAANILPSLQPVIDGTLAIPGVAGIIRPSVEVLKQNLAALAAS